MPVVITDIEEEAAQEKAASSQEKKYGKYNDGDVYRCCSTYYFTENISIRNFLATQDDRIPKSTFDRIW